MGFKHFINTLIHKDYEKVTDEFDKFCDENLDAVLYFIRDKKKLSLSKSDDINKHLSYALKKQIISTRTHVLLYYKEHLEQLEREEIKRQIKEKHSKLLKNFEDIFFSDKRANRIVTGEDLFNLRTLDKFIAQNRNRIFDYYNDKYRIGCYNFNINSWEHLEFVLTNIEEYKKFASQIKANETCLAAKENELKKEKEEKIRKIEEEHRIESLPLIQQKAETISNNKLFGIPFKFFYPYYPVSEGEDVGCEAWEARKLIWNFKGNKRKNDAKDVPIVFNSLRYSPRTSSYSQEHDNAVSYVARMLCDSLRKAFGSNMKHLTFVCVTASTKESNQIRYELFSKIVCGCGESSLVNAYEHIKILQDSVPKHLGGTGSPLLHFDEDFFRGKYVVLFDDVVTSGGSMMRYVEKLRSMGAVVVALYSIGKTTYK